MVNNKATRISIATVLGPSMELVVSPAAGLLDMEKREATYIGLTYKDYLQLQQSSQLDGKCNLYRVRISNSAV